MKRTTSYVAPLPRISGWPAAPSEAKSLYGLVLNDHNEISNLISQNLEKRARALVNDERNSTNLSEFGHVSYF